MIRWGLLSTAAIGAEVIAANCDSAGSGSPLPYGKDDAVAQARILAALARAAATGRVVGPV